MIAGSPRLKHGHAIRNNGIQWWVFWGLFIHWNSWMYSVKKFYLEVSCPKWEEILFLADIHSDVVLWFFVSRGWRRCRNIVRSRVFVHGNVKEVVIIGWVTLDPEKRRDGLLILAWIWISWCIGLVAWTLTFLTNSPLAVWSSPVYVSYYLRASDTSISYPWRHMGIYYSLPRPPHEKDENKVQGTRGSW